MNYENFQLSLSENHRLDAGVNFFCNRQDEIHTNDSNLVCVINWFTLVYFAHGAIRTMKIVPRIPCNALTRCKSFLLLFAEITSSYEKICTAKKTSRKSVIKMANKVYYVQVMTRRNWFQ